MMMLCLFSSIGSFFFGYFMVAINPNIDLITKDWPYEDKAPYVGSVTAAVPLGAVLGCLIHLIFLMDFRKRVLFILTDTFLLASIIYQFQGEDYIHFFISRIIAGICIGVNSSITSL
jgi:predicted MFS family arabinose efflux permease